MKTKFIFINFFICVFLILFSIQPLIAGNGGFGSSRYGIGDLQYFPSNRSYGMGGASFAVLTSASINRFNPATWTQLNRTRYSFGALYEGIGTKDVNESKFYSGITFSGLMVSLPIMPSNGVTLGFGISPYSRVNYNVITPSSFDTLNYNIQYIGDGGISQAHLGSSVRIGDDINLGLKIDYYSGTLNYTTKQLFVGSNYTNSEVTRRLEVSGFGATAGFVYTGLKTLFNIPQTHTLSVGGVFSTGSSLNAKEQRFYSFDASTILVRDTSAALEGKMKLPLSFGGGLAYSMEYFLFAGDFHYQKWGDYSLFDKSSTEIRNSFRISTGMEYLYKRDVSSPYFQRVAYRAGFFYNSSYYKINNQPLNEIGFTFGFGAPLFTDSRLNINFAYSFRGTTENQLQKDNIFRVSFSLSGGEVWFERPPQE
ncbi:MAG: hypothetical protein HY964_06570 [Ignavibacteriales bacterium]|nr:hypothetical protein [Ignavibacteriales bacterium]